MVILNYNESIDIDEPTDSLQLHLNQQLAGEELWAAKELDVPPRSWWRPMTELMES